MSSTPLQRQKIAAAAKAKAQSIAATTAKDAAASNKNIAAIAANTGQTPQQVKQLITQFNGGGTPTANISANISGARGNAKVKSAARGLAGANALDTASTKVAGLTPDQQKATIAQDQANAARDAAANAGNNFGGFVGSALSDIGGGLSKMVAPVTTPINDAANQTSKAIGTSDSTGGTLGGTMPGLGVSNLSDTLSKAIGSNSSEAPIGKLAPQAGTTGAAVDTTLPTPQTTSTVNTPAPQSTSNVNLGQPTDLAAFKSSQRNVRQGRGVGSFANDLSRGGKV